MEKKFISKWEYRKVTFWTVSCGWAISHNSIMLFKCFCFMFYDYLFTKNSECAKCFDEKKVWESLGKRIGKGEFKMIQLTNIIKWEIPIEKIVCLFNAV